MTRTTAQTAETKAIGAWVKNRCDCFWYEDEWDEDFIVEMKKLYRKVKGDAFKFAFEYVKGELKEDGYHDFSESGFAFLNCFLKEGLARTDWQVVGDYFVTRLSFK